MDPANQVKLLMSLPGMNATLCRTILSTLGTETIPKRLDKTFDKQLEEYWGAVCTTTRLYCKDGRPFDWSYVSLQRFLPLAVAKCPPFAALFMKQLAVFPNSPVRFWRLVFYADEVSPGNQNAPLNRRKVMVFYVSFREMGRFLLTTHAWIPIAVLRHTVANEIDGQYSAISRSMFRSLYIGSGNMSLGIFLPPPVSRIFHATHEDTLADEDAHQAMWIHLGPNGTVCCWECMNVTPKWLELEENDITQNWVDISCDDPAKFIEKTDELVYEAFDRLQAISTGRHSKKELEDCEKAWGLRYHPCSLLADLELRFIVKPSSARRDPMHTLFSNGVLGYELRPLIDVLDRYFSIGWEQLKDVCAATSLCWPGCRSQACMNACRVFNQWSAVHPHCFPGSASDLKCIVHPLRYLIRRLERGIYDEPLDSFLALADVIDMHNLLKHGSRNEENCSRWVRCVRQYFRAHKLAYGTAFLRPKHHGLFHLGRQAWLDCFTPERKNQQIGIIAGPVDNTVIFETSVIKRLLFYWFRDASLDPWSDRLSDPVVEAPCIAHAVGCRRATVARSMRFNAGTFFVGDIVFQETSTFMIRMCCLLDDSLAFSGVRLTHVRDRAYALSQQLEFFSPRDLRLAECWVWIDDQHIELL